MTLQEHLPVWAITGAPLGMNSEIPGSGGIFHPVEEESEQAQLAPELEVQLGMDNYKTISLCTMTTRGQELDRLVARGFAVYLTKAEAREHFHRATLSRLALIHRGEEAEGHY